MRNVVWQKPSTAFQHKNLTPTVKHGGERLMVWGCFAVSGLRELVIIDGTTNFGLNQQILQANVSTSVLQVKLNRKLVMQQENAPKHTDKSTTEWLKQSTH